MTATFDSESYTPEEIHAGDYPIQTETATAGAAVTAITVIGRVTSSKKVIASDPAAEDGSEVPIGISAHAAAADDDPLTFYKSGGFDISKIEKGDWTDAALIAAFDRTPITLKTLGAI
ncbi:bacteriophage lambda head decoration protein D [Litorimonas taeanensis]|uniref:Bacteriophage lambda head decoration protein D n=1 Tax=Litorimonas taeanensis TaxID=568099 RepID=A0A420WDF4_9PROT|nr:head decoration protein [Litorimonas taeanensis]RKQ68950.1 bacteriophage lambda head decoration protein D [Litorimonas taeanensis]